MKVKTFQLYFTEEKLNEIAKAAEKLNVSKKAFMLVAIDEKLKKVSETE